MRQLSLLRLRVVISLWAAFVSLLMMMIVLVRLTDSRIDLKPGEETPEQHRKIWGGQTFYRVLSHVNGGRQLEAESFAGIESPPTHRNPETADGHSPER
jgi:hypothetical protein